MNDKCEYRTLRQSLGKDDDAAVSKSSVQSRLEFASNDGLEKLKDDSPSTTNLQLGTKKKKAAVRKKREPK